MNIRLLSLFALLCLSWPHTFIQAAPAPAIEEYEEDALPQADTVAVHSAKMNRDITTVVIVPAQYFDADLQDQQYPVVYLLHGAGGNYRNWPTKANLDDMASDYSVIIVCPDGQDSWYIDSPIDPSMQYETFISRELVDYIDHNYRTIAIPAMRAITGLSMGGHGALFNAMRHPDVFGSCGSMSGCTDICNYPTRWHIADRLGNYTGNEQLWAQHSVAKQIGTLKPGKLHITIDVGCDDLFAADNDALHAAMLKRGIAHDYTVRPGSHTWDYWLNSIDYHFLYFSKAFASASE